jgi:NADPH2:quinone reductase
MDSAGVYGSAGGSSTASPPSALSPSSPSCPSSPDPSAPSASLSSPSSPAGSSSAAVSAGDFSDEVLLADEYLIERVRGLAPDGVDHIVEVAFGANIVTDIELLALGGSIATYATNTAEPEIPFWQLVFKNIRLFFLGSDDFPSDMKIKAARDINAAFEAGWTGFEIAAQIPLVEIARAHELVEHPTQRGRVVVTL